MTLAPTSARLPEAELRASDAERQQAATDLQDHFAKGRLTWDELDERLGVAWAARTRGELSALFTDLPIAPVVAAEPARRRRRSRLRFDPRLLGALLFGVALIALTRGMILIPLIAFVVIRGHRHGRWHGRSRLAGGPHGHHHHGHGRR